MNPKSNAESWRKTQTIIVPLENEIILVFMEDKEHLTRLSPIFGLKPNYIMVAQCSRGTCSEMTELLSVEQQQLHSQTIKPLSPAIHIQQHRNSFGLLASVISLFRSLPTAHGHRCGSGGRATGKSRALPLGSAPSLAPQTKLITSSPR